VNWWNIVSIQILALAEETGMNLTEWEEKFLSDLSRKKWLSNRQEEILTKIAREFEVM